MKVKREPTEFYREFKCYEKCVFCNEPTAYWHDRTNTPVCQDCSKNHKVLEINDAKRKSYSSQLLKPQHP